MNMIMVDALIYLAANAPAPTAMENHVAIDGYIDVNPWALSRNQGSFGNINGSFHVAGLRFIAFPASVPEPIGGLTKREREPSNECRRYGSDGSVVSVECSPDFVQRVRQHIIGGAIFCGGLCFLAYLIMRRKIASCPKPVAE